MQRFDLLSKLQEARAQVSSLEGDLKAHIKGFVEAHRKFKDGEKVEVWLGGSLVGTGFVSNANSSAQTDAWGIKSYLSRGVESWVRDLCDIHYSILAIKKDGTPSTRRLLYPRPRQEQSDAYHYLKPCE